MPTVFDNAKRTSPAHKLASQPIFDYLNCSARPGSEVVRRLVEDWFSRFPPSYQSELRSRFRSGDIQFAAAFHELCLHELLFRQGCKITPHPTIAGTRKQPDFEVVQPDGSRFLLEACTSTEINSGPKYEPRYNRILDFLRTKDFESVLLGVCELTAGSQDLPKSLLESHIVTALAQLDAGAGGYIAIPPFEHNGWRIRLNAYPRAFYPSRTGLLYLDSSRTPIAQRFPLRSTLKKKAGRYGKDLTLPLVISVSSLDPMLADSDYNNQLLGRCGIWGNAGRRHVSAVLLTGNLWLETLLTGQVESRLYLNPSASWPYSGVLEKLDTFSLADGSWRRCPGTPLCELLELPRCDSSLWD
jgi:hypothetical protein